MCGERTALCTNCFAHLTRSTPASGTTSTRSAAKGSSPSRNRRVPFPSALRPHLDRIGPDIFPIIIHDGLRMEHAGSGGMPVFRDLGAYGKEACKMTKNKVVHHKRHYRKLLAWFECPIGH